MKKLLLPALLLCVGTTMQAQNKEVPPPPPPEPPIVAIDPVPPPPPPPKPPKAPQKTKKVNPPVVVKDEASPAPPPPPPPAIEVVKFMSPSADKNAAAFYKRNPSVASLGWGPENRIIVRLKNKTTEKYDLNDEAQKKTFTDKYGDAPIPPPPPPPAKPTKKSSTT